MSSKTVAAGGIASGGILGVVLALYGFGVLPFKQANGESTAPSAEGERDSVATRERVAKVETVVVDLKDEVRRVSEEVVALKVEQRGLGVRLDGVKETVDRAEADQRQRFDRVMDKLDDVAVDVRRRRGK